MSANAYDELLDQFKEQSIIGSIRGVLRWDIETGKMPAKGLKHRSMQFSYLTKLSHQFWNSDKLGNLIDELEGKTFDNRVKQRNVELIKKQYKINTQLPEELVMKISSQANETNETWKKAKKKVDFSIVKPEMKKLIELNKEKADKLADIKDMNNRFDALIDERDEGMTSSSIYRYFDEARKFLVPFIKNNKDRFLDINDGPLKANLHRSEQVELAHEIATLFDYETSGEEARGNIEEVEHPLTIGCGPNDVRITVKYGNYLKVISSTNHELGHAIDNLNRNKKWIYQPVNSYGYPSMGECNSRYTENKIGKSYEYYVHMLPKINDIANLRFNEISVDEFYDCVRRIEPGTSRMKADEATYGLHIIIRFEIEKMIFDDEVTVSELPQLWNEKYEKYLGVEVPNDTIGIMQDLHWFSHYYGYFHGYFMGDLIGSQFHHYMNQEVDDWRIQLAEGDLSNVLEWHKENIYSKGALHAPLDLLKEITGEPLNVDYFKNYLKNKYAE